MDLTPEQKQNVARWATEGAGLSEIQKRLAADCGVTLTYMELRLLVMDLGLSVREKRPAQEPARSKPAVRDADDDDLPPIEDSSTPSGGQGSVAVSLDRVVRAGSVASGSVTFSDGVSATWTIDQFGRLGLVAGKQNYRPSQQDLMKFQQALRKKLESKGF